MRSTLIVWLALIGCNGNTGTDTDTTDEPPVETADTGDTSAAIEVDATARASTHIPSVFHVDFASDAQGVGHVEFGLDAGDLDRRTPDTPSGTTHSQPLLGLKAGQTYHWRAVVTDDEGTRHESPVATVDVPAAPAGLTSLDVTVDSGSTVQYVMLSLFDQPNGYVGIVDGDGDWVWWYELPDERISTQVAPSWSGADLLWNEYDGNKLEDNGQVRRVPLDGEGDVVVSRTLLGHHGFIEHTDGTLTWLGFVFGAIDVPTVGVVDMYTDRLFSAPEGADDQTVPTELFDFFDDFPVEPELTCSHVASLSFRFEYTDIREWTHTNSLAYVPVLDSYFLNSKFNDWVVRIDRATGDVVWHLGGLDGDFTGPAGEDLWPSPEESVLFSHGHMSHVWDGGMLMFDNGDHRDPQVSSVVEIAWDEGAGTAREAWSFEHPEAGFTFALGDARKMDDGNVLASWGRLSELMEVDPSGTILWRASDASGRTFGRIRHFDDLYALPAPH